MLPVLAALMSCAPAPALTMDKDNVFYAIKDGQAGTFLTVGPREGEECHWSRTSAPTEDIADVLEVGIGKPSQNTTVELRPGEYFISWGCHPWRHQ